MGQGCSRVCSLSALQNLSSNLRFESPDRYHKSTNVLPFETYSIRSDQLVDFRDAQRGHVSAVSPVERFTFRHFSVNLLSLTAL